MAAKSKASRCGALISRKARRPSWRTRLVKQALTEKGEAALPMVLVGGRVLATGRYPERDELAELGRPGRGETQHLQPAVKELVAIGAAIARQLRAVPEVSLPRGAVAGGVQSRHGPGS